MIRIRRGVAVMATLCFPVALAAAAWAQREDRGGINLETSGAESGASGASGASGTGGQPFEVMGHWLAANWMLLLIAAVGVYVLAVILCWSVGALRQLRPRAVPALAWLGALLLGVGMGFIGWSQFWIGLVVTLFAWPWYFWLPVTVATALLVGWLASLTWRLNSV